MSDMKLALGQGRIEDNYVEGYDPVSFHAPHSSLLKTSTWLGMGTILSAVPCAGIFVFGLGAGSVGSQELASFYTMVGVISTLVVVILGAATVHYGRRDYRAYVARTGRRN